MVRASALSKTTAKKETIPATPSIADERQSQLKLLIARGKEQGFLTYAEVNDHLPSEIVDRNRSKTS
jgi:RNA polymerase primary sigma factor